MEATENSNAPALDQRIERIEDERRIAEIFPRYARFVDDGDAEGIGSLFAEDGKMIVTGGYEIVGREKISKLFGKLLGEIEKSNHLVGHPMVAWDGPDRAHAEAALHAWDHYKDGRSDCYTFGRYLIDVARAEDGSWLVEAFTFDFAEQLDDALRPYPTK